MTFPHNRWQELWKAEHPKDDFQKSTCFFGSSVRQKIFFEKEGITLLESEKEVW